MEEAHKLNYIFFLGERFHILNLIYNVKIVLCYVKTRLFCKNVLFIVSFEFIMVIKLTDRFKVVNFLGTYLLKRLT